MFRKDFADSYAQSWRGTPIDGGSEVADAPCPYCGRRLLWAGRQDRRMLCRAGHYPGANSSGCGAIWDQTWDGGELVTITTVRDPDPALASARGTPTGA